MTLKIRFLLIFTSFIVVLLASASATYYALERRSLLRDQRLQALATLDQTAAVCQEVVRHHGGQAANALLRNVAREAAVHSVSCLDLRGAVLADSSGAPVLPAAQATPPRPQAGLEERQYALPDRRVVWELTRPVWDGGRPVATARARLSALLLRRQLEHRLLATLQRMFFAGLLTLLLAVPAALAVAVQFSRPISRLKAGAEKIGSGDFLHRLPVTRRDELGDLAAAFNSMALRLKEVDELKDSFLGKVTHDLRNPLSAMMGHAELLMLEKAATPDQREKSLQTIVSNGAYLAELINNILDMTMLEAGKMTFAKQPLDLHALAGALFDLMKVQAAKFGVTLALDVAPGTFVLADEIALRRVLLNFISNAMKFTPSGGKVTLSHVREGGDDLIEITDTGIGIPPEKLGVLFTKFGQVPEAQNKVRKAKGTGLGLVISKDIVEAHGGRVGVRSEPGRGATFWLRLPAGAAAAEAATAERSAARVAVVVDDDEDNLASVAGALRREGFTTHTAASVAAAMAAVASARPGLVVTDIHLPDGNGYDLCRSIKATPGLEGTAVILMTGTYHKAEDRLKAFDHGADFYLLKPFLSSELAQAVQKTTARG